MRIIAGEFKGRAIVPPVDRTTRPMLARVREALFSTLGALIEDARILDLFSGTGSLGLEALSRGAATVRFVERDRRALQALRENVEALDVTERSRVQAGSALDAYRWGDEDFDLIFMDPPYPWFRDGSKRTKLFRTIRDLSETKLAAGGALVLHTHPRDVDAIDFDLEPLPEKRVYGNTALWYVWKPMDAGASE